MARRKATVVRRTTTSLSRLMKSGESIILVEVVVQTGFCFVHPNTLQYNSALQHVYLTYFSAEQVISQDGKCVASIFSIQISQFDCFRLLHFCVGAAE